MIAAPRSSPAATGAAATTPLGSGLSVPYRMPRSSSTDALSRIRSASSFDRFTEASETPSLLSSTIEASLQTATMSASSFIPMTGMSSISPSQAGRSGRAVGNATSCRSVGNLVRAVPENGAPEVSRFRIAATALGCSVPWNEPVVTGGAGVVMAGAFQRAGWMTETARTATRRYRGCGLRRGKRRGLYGSVAITAATTVTTS